MALNLNGNSPKKILFNGLNVAKVLFNGVIVWIAKILQFLSGYPLTLENSTGENLVDYKIYGNQDPEAIILPVGYTQLEYIESTGTQWLDADLDGVSKTVQIQSKFSISQQKSFQCLFCCREGVNSAARALFFMGTSTLRNDQARQKRSINVRGFINQIKTLDSSQTKFRLDDNVLTTYNNGTGDNINSKFTILDSYDDNKNMSDQYGFVGKLYYFKIYDNNVLVRDFIPCKNSNNEVGLYDLVENKFYSNSGTGDFVAGNEIILEKVGDKYYKAGEQLYKIPIKVSNDTETEYEIYLNKPLGKIEENADYIDFENQEVAYYDYLTDTYTKENIELPEIPTQKGTNIITVETSLKPSKMSVLYYKEGGN